MLQLRPVYRMCSNHSITDSRALKRCVGVATPFVHDQEIEMQLKGSKTEQNLKDAFAGKSQANRRGRRQLSH